MGKRRDWRKDCIGGDNNATGGRGYGGGGGDNGKFRVFDFADEEQQVESESRRALEKFGIRNPSKKAAHHREPVDKYHFLQCFASGAVECSSSGANSHGRMDSGGYTAGQKHNKVVDVYIDDYECLELRSPTSSNMADDEGSIEEQSSDCGKYSENNDCEAVVTIYPIYVKYKNKYYTRCLLTLAQRWIRLEGPLCDQNVSSHLEWSNFDILKIVCQQCESVGAGVVNLILRSKGLNAAETGKRNSGRVELEFAVNHPKWSRKQEEIKSLDLQYKTAWETFTSVYSFNEPFEDIIYPEGDPDAVLISRGDIELLQPKTFINDTLIDFYIKYLLTKIKLEEQHRFYFFNTFFFRKLVDMDQDVRRTGDTGGAFQRVRKWTRNVNLFERDYIFIPINYRLHWSLIVVCHPGEVANIRDNSMNNSSKVPCILHMDSLRGSHTGFENIIKSYLWEEWKEQWNKQEECFAMKFLNLDFVAPQLPQQENLFDCGLFLLHFAELFLEKASNTSSPNFDFLNEDWFHPAEVSLRKRSQIRNLIYRIVEDKAQKHPPAACDDKYLHIPINAGDGGAQSFKENGVKESGLGVKFDTHDDFHEFHGTGSANFVTGGSCEPIKQLVPINEFSNMGSPVEEQLERQKAFPPQNTTIRCKSAEDVKPVDLSWASSRFMSEEVKVSRGSSETCCCKSPITCDIQSEEYNVPKAEKEWHKISSTSSKDLMVEDSEEETVVELNACIVEDSEEETLVESNACMVEDSDEVTVVESNRKIRGPTFL